jgi:hypothetical protein
MVSCPVCATSIERGHHRCDCGTFFFHEWQGGGLLQAVSGIWRWWSEGNRWQQVEKPPAPAMELVPARQVAAYTTAGVSLVVTVTITR